MKTDNGKAIVLLTTILILTQSETAYAGTINDSLKPLVDVLKDLAEPVSYGFMVKGFMKVMAGDEHEGIKTIKHAIGGFIGIQWIPYIFKIIKGINF